MLKIGWKKIASFVQYVKYKNLKQLDNGWGLLQKECHMRRLMNSWSIEWILKVTFNVFAKS